MWFLLILIAVPMIEIALFIKVGGLIGVWPTLGLVILTAVAGTTLMRIQGVQALGKLQRNLETGGDPRGPMAHGALILVAGFLLLLPGFLTDILGILLLIPPIRSWVIARGAARMTVRATSFARGSGGGAARPSRDAIDADYEVVEDDPAKVQGQKSRGTSGWTRPNS